MCKVSIITATHNRAEWLRGSIESARSAGSDAEIIVVDDASTDETPEICRETSGIRSLRLDQNVGQATARNAGIKISKGEYVTFLDDDDRRLPGSLDAQVSLLDSDPDLSFVYGPVILGDPTTGLPTGELSRTNSVYGDIFWRLLEGNFIYIPSVVARKKFVAEVGCFDPTSKVEDWLLWIRLAERHRVGAVDKPVAIYREPNRTSGQTSSNIAAICRTSAETQEKGLRLPRALEASAERRREVRRNYLNGIFWQPLDESIACFLEGNYAAALGNWGSAIKLNPRSALHPYTIKSFLTKLRKTKYASGSS